MGMLLLSVRFVVQIHLNVVMGPKPHLMVTEALLVVSAGAWGL